MEGNTQFLFPCFVENSNSVKLSPYWRGDSAHLVKNSSAFYGARTYMFLFCVWGYVRISAGTPNMLTAICSDSVSSYSMVHNLSSAQSAPYQSYLDPIYVILRSPLRPSNWSRRGFPPSENCVCIFLCHAYHMPGLSQLPWFNNSGSSQRGGQIMMLLIM
jgi:hypothetical protein